MNWHRRPELVDRLAAEYALGTMTGGARRRFEAVMQAHPTWHARRRWERQLLPLSQTLPELPPAGDALWSRIEGRLFGRSEPRPQPWWRRIFGAVPAAALAFGLVAGLALPTLLQPPPSEDTQLPESYVGVLATTEGRPGLIVASRRQGRVLDLKTVQPVALPPDRMFVLWTLDAEGRAQAVGALPAPLAPFGHVTLAQPSEALFARAVELAVSVEAGPPPPAPTTAFVYRGLCGKLWPPKPTR